MASFYFFENDKQCVWMRSELGKNWPYYLKEPLAYDELGLRFQKRMVPYEGKKKFYVIADFINHVKIDKIPEVQLLYANQFGYNIVKSIEDLPPGAGIYITGYDSYALEVEQAIKNGISVINNGCPWIQKLKQQILSVNPDTHQCILLMDQQHILYRLYKQICPKDTIYILPENYMDEIRKHKNEKPIHLCCYVTFRVVEIERIISFIEAEYPHPENDLGGYKITQCAWTKQGIYEELNRCIEERNIREFWLIYTSVTDRSLRSLVNELNERHIKHILIRNPEDVPASVAPEDRIGIIVTPVPIAPVHLKKILDTINKRFIEPS